MDVDSAISECPPAHSPDWLPRLAHDLRGPLAPIRMAAQVLEGSEITAHEQSELGKAIERQANVLSQLADDLDDVLRISQGEFRMRLAPCDLDTIVHNAVAQFSRQACVMGIPRRTVTVRMAAGPIMVNADDEKLTQLLVQMLRNVAPVASADASCWIGCACDGTHALVRLHDSERRIYRNASVEYLTTGEPPLDPGTLGMAPVIGREIATGHAATVSIGDESERSIGELLLRLPVALA